MIFNVNECFYLFEVSMTDVELYAKQICRFPRLGVNWNNAETSFGF